MNRKPSLHISNIEQIGIMNLNAQKNKLDNQIPIHEESSKSSKVSNDKLNKSNNSMISKTSDSNTQTISDSQSFDIQNLKELI